MVSFRYPNLIITTASLAFIHTLAGPDHYLPFIVISKARNWKLGKTIWFTALCGLGHVGSSVLLGFFGVALGITLGKLQFWDGMRGSIVSWIFLAFGLIYMVWGIRCAIRNKPHTHIHYHPDGHSHEHEHTHHNEHTHIHKKKEKENITPWILFTIFIFGPCEPLIPIVMYPAAKNDYSSLLLITLVFCTITIVMMIVLVTTASFGFKFLPMKNTERYSHALAGVTIFVCGMGMVFLCL